MAVSGNSSVSSQGCISWVSSSSSSDQFTLEERQFMASNFQLRHLPPVTGKSTPAFLVLARRYLEFLLITDTAEEARASWRLVKHAASPSTAAALAAIAVMADPSTSVAGRSLAEQQPPLCHLLADLPSSYTRRARVHRKSLRKAAVATNYCRLDTWLSGFVAQVPRVCPGRQHEGGSAHSFGSDKSQGEASWAKPDAAGSCAAFCRCRRPTTKIRLTPGLSP